MADAGGGQRVGAACGAGGLSRGPARYCARSPTTTPTRLRGRGLAAEAMAAVLDFGFDRMALQRIEIWTESANVRSVRMAARRGFVHEGTLRGYVREDDGSGP
ncbi:GNAT family N-acetyltransferase [Pseudonocardia sp. N23]|uniref:GNAT family N-acetyltransferase n=1 Tax=Pseudonocardia sp. N23 TaxID=1987376 RepID=UPI002112DF01|nr:GNAT family protein [Pseudonocardia sp. N23]